MKKARLSIVLTASALAAISFGQEEAPAPFTPPALQAATDAEGLRAAQARLTELKALPAQTTLLCGSSLQFPFYHFAVLPRHSPAAIAEQWGMSFGSLAPYALANAGLAAEMFAEGSRVAAEMEDGEARQELVRQFQSFGNRQSSRPARRSARTSPPKWSRT